MQYRLAAALLVASAFVLGTAVPADAARDRKAPTRPKNVRVIGTTDSTVTIAWTRSRDNVRVRSYTLFRNGRAVGRTTKTRYTFTNLEADTSYRLGVAAYDTSGNRSATTTTTTKTRPASSPPRNRKAPTISGTAQEGQTLTAGEGAWWGNPTSFAYQWLRCTSSGASCVDVPGANGKTFGLGTGDLGSTMRVRVTAWNGNGSASATSAQTAVVMTAPAPAPPAPAPTEPAPPPPPPPPSGFPASFFTGPLGMGNILPGKTTGVLLGTFSDGTWDQQKSQWLSRESYIGRQFDFYALHYAAQNDTCDWGGTVAPYTGGREAWIVNRGGIPVISWTHGWTIASVNAGHADACLRTVARRAAAFGHRHLFRPYWEFNGDWMRWSAYGQPFIDAWRRTVRLFREEGATNVGFIWSPDGGYRERAFQSYPGDEWVDWVGMSLYNMNRTGAWCSPYDSGPWCEVAHVLSHDPAKYPTIYDRYSGQKPFILSEHGSVEDPALPGRKGQWFRNARDQIKAGRQNLRGITYFDTDLTKTEGFNWRIDTSASSFDAFRELALDPFFRTRS